MSSPTSRNTRKCNLPEDSIARHIADYWAKVVEVADDPEFVKFELAQLYTIPASALDKDGRIKSRRGCV